MQGEVKPGEQTANQPTWPANAMHATSGDSGSVGVTGHREDLLGLRPGQFPGASGSGFRSLQFTGTAPASPSRRFAIWSGLVTRVWRQRRAAPTVPGGWRAWQSFAPCGRASQWARTAQGEGLLPHSLVSTGQTAPEVHRVLSPHAI
jgi:hypothetical protein